MELLDAIANKKWDVAKKRIESGIDLNQQDANGNTALHYLCYGSFENFEMLEMLLKAGANPDIRNKEKMTPLFLLGRICYADEEEKYRRMKLLLDYGADKNIHCIKASTAEEEAERRGDQKAIALYKKYKGGKWHTGYPSEKQNSIMLLRIQYTIRGICL